MNMNNDISNDIQNENKINPENCEEYENNKIKNNEKQFLLKLIINNNIFNEKKTEFKDKIDFDLFIDIINKLNYKEIFSIFNYFNKIRIQILKILINGFIEFDINDVNKENNILLLISKSIHFYFNKNIFYFIYDKLSQLFREHQKIKGLNLIIKFEKIFKIWKLLHNIDNFSSDSKKNNISNIALFSNLSNPEKNLIIQFGKKMNIGSLTNGADVYIITIDFEKSPILDLNEYNENFSFIKLIDNKDYEFDIKYSDVFTRKNHDDNIKNNINKINFFSKVNTIKFNLCFRDFSFQINGSEDIKRTDLNFSFNSIKKIEILNGFFGEFSSIKIIKDLTIVKKEAKKEILEIFIKKYISMNKKEHKIECNINLNGEEINNFNKNNDLIKIEGVMFSDSFFDINNDKYLNKSKLNSNEIKYFGGIDSFIPLFKLIKYIVVELGKFINKNENFDVNQYFLKSLIYIKDILIIIIRLICINENNYNYFLKISVPLIGAISEILEPLKKLYSDSINFLKNEEVFFILYIIIFNTDLPNNIKKAFKALLKINENPEIINLSLDSIILDINKIGLKNLDWYFLFIFNLSVFFFINFDSNEKILFNLKEQLNNILIYMKKEEKNKKIIEAMIPLFNFINDFCLNSRDDNIFINYKYLLKDNKLYFKYILHLIKNYIISHKVLNKHNSIAHMQKVILKDIKIYFNEISPEQEIEIINTFKFNIKEFQFLIVVFEFLKKENFIPESQLVLNEIIDYHGQYHHLMKELFVFNRMWSNRNIFFKKSLEEIQNNNLKYKNINYYTRNFQRPIIYPILDYKHRYPKFSKFNITKDFYQLEKEDPDDYDFDLVSHELDDYIIEFNKKILEKIKTIETIQCLENICLVKQEYHVKGRLLIVKNEGNEKNIIIYFISYPYDFQNNIKFCPTCNKKEEYIKINMRRNKNELCFGSFFECPENEANRIIRIDSDEIRLLAKRIYYYRKSAIEIFTETKSYYFNLNNENEMLALFSSFQKPYKNSHFPINVNGDIIAYKKINKKFFEKINYDGLLNKSNNFIEFISNKISKREFCEMCMFDLIMIINLISNRSFNDLLQYPIFPTLFLFESRNNNYKNNIFERNLSKHIGFQQQSEGGKARLNLLKKIYYENRNDSEVCLNKEIYYFNTHYSNIVYVTNFLIRLFPYSFLAVELQGDGFDNPNRLFCSIEDTFYNISVQKSDLRELIPEFFYLPEMFMNINSINFGKKKNNLLVDDIIINKDIFWKPFFNNDNNHENKDEKNKKNTEIFFTFVEYMKNTLELSKGKLKKWINIIFGTKQKFNNAKEQFFRTESYIDIDKETYKQYINDDIIMNSVEFGLIPLQTIYNRNLLWSLRKNNYEKVDKSIEKELIIQSKGRKSTSYKEKEKENEINIELNEENDSEDENYFNINDKIVENYFQNDYKDYWEDSLNISFKANNDEEIGKLEIYKNGVLKYELFDHNDKIIDLFYNKRLNMFATCSLDGYICIYILPNKLFSMIKHPKTYYDKVFLSANPFPSIIAIDKKENKITSFSLSGIIINSLEIKNIFKNE